MVMTQAAMFVLPSVILGFGLAIPCIYLIYTMLFTADMGFHPSYFPDWYSSTMALLIGIFIPILSSIIPIKRALSTTLIDALNTQRAKTTGIVITFTNNSTKNIGPYLLFGSISVIFGVLVYYFLPLSILKMNYGMILYIFFLLLLSMMLGLTLFVTNL